MDAILHNFNIFINGKFLAQPITGVQRFACEILVALDDLLQEESLIKYRFTLVTPVPLPNDFPELGAIQVQIIPHFNLHFWEQYILPRSVGSAKLLNLSGSAPIFKRNQICTFHDAAVFDVPYAYSFLFRIWYRLLFRVQAHINSGVLTVSEFSKVKLLQHLSLLKDDICIVNNAADSFLTKRTDDSVLSDYDLLSGDYFLAVGSANPTKNFSSLLQAFSRLVVARPAARLVVVGGVNNQVFRDRQYLDNDRYLQNVVFTSRLSDSRLKSLYIHARAFVFPSTYEGFGLPPLEAMSCGCPVLAADAAAIPEICADGAVYFSPLDIDTLTSLLIRCLDDSTWLQALSVRAMQRTVSFSWRASAQQCILALRHFRFIE